MADNNQFRNILDGFIDGSAYKGPLPPTAMETVANAARWPALRAAMNDPNTGKQIPVPPNASVNENIQAARTHADPFWFNQVNDTSPWDYKLQGPKGRFEPFGNFNYGATGTAFGFPQQILDRPLA